MNNGYFFLICYEHPEWDSSPFEGFPNDVALLRLTQAADVEPAPVGLGCLPPQPGYDVTGTECWITGWGYTDCTSPQYTTQYDQSYAKNILLKTKGNTDVIFATLPVSQDFKAP